VTQLRCGAMYNYYYNGKFIAYSDSEKVLRIDEHLAKL